MSRNHTPKIMMRDNTYEGEKFIDFVIFWCPIRDRLACAVVDNEGYYWVYPKWYGDFGPCYREDHPKVKWVTFPLNEHRVPDDSHNFTRGCHEMIQFLNDGTLWMGFFDDKIAAEEMWDALYGKGTMKAVQKCARMKHHRTCKKKEKIRRMRAEQQELEDAE